MNVCEALLEVLADYGVKYIFGIPGDAVNDLVEAVRRQDRIRFIHVMHEEAGAFAASAQAKLSGELAVCVGTAGPGAVHLLNGLYDAKMDHAPVLAITGQVDTSLLGLSSHQEVDLVSLFSDVASFNQMIVDAAQMPRIAGLACHAAISGKCVAHISLPVNIATMKVKDFEKNNQVLETNVKTIPCSDDLARVAGVISSSERPCILAGIGSRGATKELVNFAELIKAPVIKTLRGKDLLPDLHPLTLGGIGMLGTKPAVSAMESCDLLIIIGSDFPYSEFYPGSDTITVQIDHVPRHIGRRHAITYPLAGDVKHTLAALLPLLKPSASSKFLESCQSGMKRWVEKQSEVERSDASPIRPQSLAFTIGEAASDDAIVCCDTGAVTVWGARHFQIKGTQQFTLSGGLASMAFALPAAIGAQLSYPQRQVIALCGDGGFAMLMADLATAVKYKLPVKIFIFNNGKLGLIQMEQEAGSGNPEYQTSLNNPDYAVFAEACGAKGYTVRHIGELRKSITEILGSDLPCVVNVFVNPGELTLPPEISAVHAINYIRARTREYFS